MFKRLFQKLTGQRETTQEEPSAAPASMGDEEPMITVFDTFGRELALSKAYWRAEILLPDIAKDWDDPEKLYSHIEAATRHDLHVDVINAARHLITIDPDAERSHALLGSILINSGNLDEAEKVLLAGTRMAGQTAFLLINLAALHGRRNQLERMEATLEQAVSTDPNMSAALGRRLHILHEREGNEACLNVLRDLAKRPGTWLPQLWLAREHLGSGEVDQALALYRKVLDAGYTDGYVIQTISGDLGQKGRIADIIELLAPIYQPAYDNASAGLNLLQAYLDLHRRDEGLVLLQKLYRLDFMPLKNQLDQFTQAFEGMAIDDTKQVPVDLNNLDIVNAVFTQPIWTYGLQTPDWLISIKPDSTPTVLFFPIAVTGETPQSGAHRENSSGQLSRTIALYLSEAVHMWTDFAGNALMHIIKNVGPGLVGEEPAGGKALFEHLPDQTAFCVTGTLRVEGEQFSLKLSLWKRDADHCVHECHSQGSELEIQASLLGVEKELLSRIGPRNPTPFYDFYTRPEDDALPHYLVVLNQSLHLAFAANDLVSKDGFHNERDLLERPLKLMLEWPQIGQLGVAYVSGLAKAQRYGSEIIGDFERRSRQLAEGDDLGNKMVARLHPLLDRVFSRQVKGDPSGGEDYRQWIDRVKNDIP